MFTLPAEFLPAAEEPEVINPQIDLFSEADTAVAFPLAVSSSLNDEQKEALYAIHQWLNDPFEPFFVLSGGAGTGKTFCVRELTALTRGIFAFTAPTNKATKVLRESVSTEDYHPLCRTIYSLLGLTMSKEGSVKKIKAPKDPLKLSEFTAIIVDEAGQIGTDLLAQIERAAYEWKVRFLFMGDHAQLNPIGEKLSAVWNVRRKAELTKVMRYDNAILRIVTKIRSLVDVEDPHITLKSDNNHIEGVWKLEKEEFEAEIKIHARAGLFSQPDQSKVLAWRNIRVEYFNQLIRDIILGDKNAPTWVPGDRALFASAIRDKHEQLIASIDDEGEVVTAEVQDIGGYKSWLLNIRLDDGREVLSNPIHEDSVEKYMDLLKIFAEEARRKERRWDDFWDLKEMFPEMKYAYALTTHRAQGSTYETAFVCWQDILRNPNRSEAFRSLHVGASRPRKRLIFS